MSGAPLSLSLTSLARVRVQNSKSDIWLCHRGGTSGGHEEVVVKLVGSREHASEEARVLRQLRHVPHVAQLLEVVDCGLPDSTFCSGLVMPYYPLSAADAHGIRFPAIAHSILSYVDGVMPGISSAQLDSDIKFTRYARQLLEAQTPPLLPAMRECISDRCSIVTQPQFRKMTQHDTHSLTHTHTHRHCVAYTSAGSFTVTSLTPTWCSPPPHETSPKEDTARPFSSTLTWLRWKPRCAGPAKSL